MSPHATLFHPFSSGLLDAPEPGARALFLGAEPGFRLPDGFDAALTLAQGFRPYFLALRREGRAVEPVPAGENFDLALVALGRHRGESERRLADALARLRPGGLLVAGGAKSDGADSVRKRLAAVLPLDGRASKHHGVAFWLRRPAGLPEPLFDAAPDAPSMDGVETAPGMFSHGRADPGSRLLADHLPATLAGDVADFCAGWGYLSLRLAEAFPRVSRVDLYEAGWASLEAAKRNLAGRENGKALGFFWRDLAAEPVERRYDAVVMNPPFHVGSAADPALGESMIRAAARALKGGGALWMVANRGLPYERALRDNFANVAEVVRDGGFKVLSARR